MKQVILVRDDLKLPKGKMCSQVAHASVECVLKSPKSKLDEWHKEGMKKVVLKVKDFEELNLYLRLANAEKLTTALITDAGKTTVEPGTVTCLGIGPDEEERIDKLTAKLKMI
jgi:PTH2 family peptidyl-tRNA hydrolase